MFETVKFKVSSEVMTYRAELQRLVWNRLKCIDQTFKGQGFCCV